MRRNIPSLFAQRAEFDNLAAQVISELSLSRNQDAEMKRDVEQIKQGMTTMTSGFEYLMKRDRDNEELQAIVVTLVSLVTQLRDENEQLKEQQRSRGATGELARSLPSFTSPIRYKENDKKFRLKVCD